MVAKLMNVGIKIIFGYDYICFQLSYKLSITQIATEC